MTTLTTEDTQYRKEIIDKDEVLKMARQVGYNSFEALKWEQALTDFAKLVAAKAFQDGYSIGESAGFKEGIKLERKARGEA
jgi:hypothetical protein